MNVDIKVILVTRRTRLQELVAQYNTEEQTRFVIESRGQRFQEYYQENSNYLQAVTAVEAVLTPSARVQKLDREFLPNFIFGPKDIVVVVGQDGLVANTLKYLKGQPLIAINPEPSRYDGVLLPFEVKDARVIVGDVARGIFKTKNITLGRAEINDGQELIAVNDFFIGPRSHTSARYELTVGSKMEAHSSSGIIVSTGLGSTGWMKSVLAGAQGIAGTDRELASMPWDCDYLQFAVREPFPSQTTGVDLVFGQVTRQSRMTVASKMASHGVIFSDGMVDDYIEFNSGAICTVGISDAVGRLVV
jgi:NAD kinase